MWDRCKLQGALIVAADMSISGIRDSQQPWTTAKPSLRTASGAPGYVRVQSPPPLPRTLHLYASSSLQSQLCRIHTLYTGKLGVMQSGECSHSVCASPVGGDGS
jgi:hypothetical protein